MPKTTCPQGMSQKFWDRFLGLKMADEAMGLADSQQILRMNREAIQATLRAQAAAVSDLVGGADKAVKGQAESGDDMIHIGDLTQTITHQAPKTSKLGTLAKLAIGAGLLATGAGAAMAIPLLFSGAKDIVTPTTEAPDWQFDLVPDEKSK